MDSLRDKAIALGFLDDPEDTVDATYDDDPVGLTDADDDDELDEDEEFRFEAEDEEEEDLDQDYDDLEDEDEDEPTEEDYEQGHLGEDDED